MELPIALAIINILFTFFNSELENFKELAKKQDQKLKQMSQSQAKQQTTHQQVAEMLSNHVQQQIVPNEEVGKILNSVYEVPEYVFFIITPIKIRNEGVNVFAGIE